MTTKTLSLVAEELEGAVSDTLSSLNAKCQPGPKGEHDLELFFPEPFVRRIRDEYTTRLDVNKRFVVEVKSNLRGGAKISDLRQLHDWVLRETERVVPPETHDHLLYALEEAKLDAEYALPEDQAEMSEDDIDGIRYALEELATAVDVALMSTTYRVKGLLVVNHHVAAEGLSTAPVLEPNALRYAKANHLATVSWRQLLEVRESVKDGNLDPINFWCALFETDGEFIPAAYNWKERVSFQGSLFSDDEVVVTGQPKFLRPEPEVILSRYIRDATEPHAETDG